jgi:hypothetical protein
VRTAATRPTSRARARAARWPLVLALAAAVLFRLPAILHADETNSDAAVVGLQAMHLLRGEWSPFLWGSGYQTSVDSAFAALWFGLFGASARTLVLSSLSLHLVLTSLAWSVLARRLNPVRAALAIFPLVLTSSPLQTYILYPPREASLAIAVAALWAFDRAADARRARAFATGGVLLALACFADPYALVLVPPIGAFGLACAIDRADARASLSRAAALAGGCALGTAPFLLLRGSAHATHGQLALDVAQLSRNARLLVDPCLPWTLGARAWGATSAIDYGPWDGPPFARGLLVVGGTLFLCAITAGAASVFVRTLPWSVRRLAIAGGLALPVTIAGFLVSPMVMDVFSARYLAAIPLLAPFALAPIVDQLGARRFTVALAPAAAACAIAGWVGYGPFLRTRPSGPSDEARLAQALDARGVHVAMADYWAAYRLTFLTRERLVVVPTSYGEDRYPPYRAAFDADRTFAYVFDPERSREPAGSMEQRALAGETEYTPLSEPFRVGRFTALVLMRPARRGARDVSDPGHDGHDLAPPDLLPR